MASLHFTCGRWVIAELVRDERGQRIGRRKRKFRTEAEARAVWDAEGLMVEPRNPFGIGGARGKRSRTEAEVLAHLAENAALDDTGCLVWTGNLTNAGYGRLTWKPSADLFVPGAHRISYHLLNGPIPDGLVIDHLCRNRACIHPDHLDVVTQRENVMRSPIAPGAINAAKTHCPQGHPYSPENTYTYRLKTRSTTCRVCRTCQAAYVRRYNARKKEMAS